MWYRNFEVVRKPGTLRALERALWAYVSSATSLKTREPVRTLIIRTWPVSILSQYHRYSYHTN